MLRVHDESLQADNPVELIVSRVFDPSEVSAMRGAERM